MLCCCFLFQLFLFLLPFTSATIAGYESKAEMPAAAPPAPNCANLDETSEANANGPNPFCVYPALIGDHPSPGRRPGATNPTQFSGTAFNEDHGAGESPAGGFQEAFEPGVGPFKPAGRRRRGTAQSARQIN
ncbi:hypothetical protein niasHS_011218 [Heterodera schachtii]|uniref:Secreted protein n=1 Tax=Heterodera schachtii TaxID=97005 RepID=A0ABD2IVW5_HETSC